MKAKVIQVETHITHSCNLQCHGCTHFSQEVHAGRETVASFREHNEPWAERLDPRFFLVLGGEPTLNPDLCDILVESRRIWRQAEIRLVTNGWFLHKHPRLKEVLPQQRIRLDVSIHHDDLRYLAKLEEIKALAASWGAPIAWRESFRDWKAYYRGEGKDARPFDDRNPQASWDHCDSRWCMTILDGLLYKCPLTAYVPMHVAKMGGQINGGDPVSMAWGEYMAYKPLSPDCTDAELVEFTSRRAESCCGMCPANPQHLHKPYPVRGSLPLVEVPT